MSRKSKQRRADLLAKCPPSATRILVLTAKGDKKYKPLDALDFSDLIQTKKNGDPIVMKLQPGRKSPLAVGPVNPTVAAILARKVAAMSTDEILVQIKANPESPELLTAIIVGLGEEQASLKFEREEASREGKDTSGLSSKRVQALRATADTWFKWIDQLTGAVVDLESPMYSALFEHTMGSLHQAARATKLRDEQIEILFTRFSTIVGTPEWKEEARLLMKKASK